MARNPIQFQKGLSLIDFFASFGTEGQCRAELEKLGWPDGFRCPKCGGKQFCRSEKRNLLQCSGCHHQTSVKAGTIFHGSKTPLVKWFLLIYLVIPFPLRGTKFLFWAGSRQDEHKAQSKEFSRSNIKKSISHWHYAGTADPALIS